MSNDSIARVERWRINGVDQSVIIRGRHRSDPLLVWVGDLWCETPIFRHYNADLERHFVVVYWCQRYSGQSLDPFAAPPIKLTLDQYVDDLDDLVGELRARFNKNPVVLIGHSSGTAIGLRYTLRHPQNVAAYVGVGQIVNQEESLTRGRAFALAAARGSHNQAAVADLEQVGGPPYGEEAAIRISKWVIKFGGAFHANLSYAKLALLGVSSPEANWRDITAFMFGERFTAPLTPELGHLAFDRENLTFEAPIFLLSGRYDHRTDGLSAQTFLNAVHAPLKGFVWFENSAHSPPFEEHDRFNAWIVDHIRPLAIASR